ncbi:MAG TPA: hypothetical protein VFE33_02600 [Thermoanaerobaculia bacterium]|nr:hypothetical protein [Thermoanaerobaculia bacterium]
MMARQTPEAKAQEEVAKVARELSGLKYWLRKAVSTLPEARRPDLDHDPDVATELRAIVGCVITDSLDPAIADLETVAHYRPERPARRRSARPATAGKESEEAVESLGGSPEGVVPEQNHARG